MKSERFRVRGYDVFQVQGWGNEVCGGYSAQHGAERDL